MTFTRLAALPILACALAACESEAERQAEMTEDQIEQPAGTSTPAMGDEIAALGLTETELLDADLVDADGTDLGDVEQVRRSADGTVEGVLVSIEDSDPERIVLVTLDGLTSRPEGDDTDLQTTMTAEELAALPEAELDARSTTTGATTTTGDAPPPPQ
jgi:hypothetical protein